MPPPSGVVRRHVWVLSDLGLAGWMRAWTIMNPPVLHNILQEFVGDTALIFPDHRGTGDSTPLVCPNRGDPDWTDLECAQYLRQTLGPDALASFTVTNAARDLDFLVRALSLPVVGEGNVHLHGIGYGSLLAQRTLLLASFRPATVTLDSVVPPDRFVPETVLNYEYVGRGILNQCSRDFNCSAKLWGADPAAMLSLVFAALRDNRTTCLSKLDVPAPVTAAVLRMTVTFIAKMNFGLLLPALINRIVRCGPADVPVLSRVFMVAETSFAPKNDAIPNTYKWVSKQLQDHITSSELLTATPGVPVDVAAINAAAEAQMFADSSALVNLPVLQAWPRYPVDSYFGAYPGTHGGLPPILLLTGDADPAMPWAEHVAKQYMRTGNDVRSVVVTGASSNAVGAYQPRTIGAPCGVKVLSSFVLSNGTTVNQACVSETSRDFMGTDPSIQQFLFAIFGTNDLWG